MKNKLNVYEIINKKEMENQEQSDAPDFDLLNVKELIDDSTTVFDKKISAKTKLPEKKRMQEDKKVLKKNTSVKLIKRAFLVCVVIVLAAAAFTAARVGSDCMSPLISKGDWVVINKWTKNHKKNDIVAFKDENGKRHIARIVAVEGDFVDIRKSDRLYINNKIQEEVAPAKEVSVTFPIIVDEDAFFVLGDNREESVDSRDAAVGLLNEQNIDGKVILCMKRL